MKKSINIRYFLLVCAITIGSDLILTGGVVINQNLIDAVLSANISQVRLLVPVVIIYAAFSGGVYTFSGICQEKYSANTAMHLRHNVFSGIMGRTRKDFNQTNYSDYISALTNDVSRVQRQYIEMIFQLLFYTGSMLLSLLLMFWYNPLIAITALFCSVLMAILPGLLGEKIGKREKKYSEALASMTICLTELFAGFQVISSYGIWDHAKDKFNACNQKLQTAEFHAKGMSSFSQGISQLLSVTAQSLILSLSCYMVFQGKMSMGALVAFVSLNQSFCASLSMLLRVAPLLQGTLPIRERLHMLADYQPGARGFAIPSLQEELTVDHLSFQYQENEPVLNDISFSIHAGEKCALIGPNGSGKTTLIRLLTGELDGYEGSICYDGTELNEIASEKICSIAAVIHQDVYLFDDSIRNNICLSETFSEEEFQRALQLSGVDKFLPLFSDGVDHQVGQAGTCLSGGQRQRVAIARALIRHRPFLILDEGTSALDQETASAIEAELLAIPDLTLLAITHHLQFEEQYNQILTLPDKKPA